MIDFGLLALFAVQVALAFLVYHAWNGIKREIKDVLALKEDIKTSTEAGHAATKSAVENAATIEERVKAAEAIPGALVKRVTLLEETLKESDRLLSNHGERITSLGARLSSHLREFKRSRGDTDPASKDEDAESITMEASPGSLFDAQQPAPDPGIRPGFGVLKRRAG